MATFSIVQGQTGYIDPQVQYADSGWVVDGIFATHYPCFSGTMTYTPALPFVDGQTYVFTYTVDSRTSGGVRLDLGAHTGAFRSAAGTYTETFLFTTGDLLKFYSDGALTLHILSVYEQQDVQVTNSATISFNETFNRWASDYSFVPDCMLRFGDDFYSFSNGTLWQHETNHVAGMFYGTKYPVQISIVANPSYEVDKLWYNLRLDANGKWYVPVLETSPTNQFPNGMLSRLKKNNLSLIDGKLFGAILRDLTDPNFASEPNQAIVIYKARMLQGGWLILEFECNDNEPSEISSIEVYYTDVHRTY